MKQLIGIFALFTLSEIVRSAWLIAAAQPVILSLGAMLAAIDLDVLDVSWLPFVNKQEASAQPEVEKGE